VAVDGHRGVCGYVLEASSVGSKYEGTKLGQVDDYHELVCEQYTNYNPRLFVEYESSRRISNHVRSVGATAARALLFSRGHYLAYLYKGHFQNWHR
jgi:hypothetical protein